jgi:hypothetical protein
MRTKHIQRAVVTIRALTDQSGTWQRRETGNFGFGEA